MPTLTQCPESTSCDEDPHHGAACLKRCVLDDDCGDDQTCAEALERGYPRDEKRPTVCRPLDCGHGPPRNHACPSEPREVFKSPDFAGSHPAAEWTPEQRKYFCAATADTCNRTAAELTACVNAEATRLRAARATCEDAPDDFRAGLQRSA